MGPIWVSWVSSWDSSPKQVRSRLMGHTSLELLGLGQKSLGQSRDFGLWGTGQIFKYVDPWPQLRETKIFGTGPVQLAVPSHAPSCSRGNFGTLTRQKSSITNFNLWIDFKINKRTWNYLRFVGVPRCPLATARWNSGHRTCLAVCKQSRVNERRHILKLSVILTSEILLLRMTCI